jgi:signal transduction histidine kinase
LFRIVIVQESLTNITKHAFAEQVEISIVIENKSLKPSISDHGQGLKTGFKTKLASYGLKGMHERAIALGGKLTVTRENHNGVQIPMNKEICCGAYA